MPSTKCAVCNVTHQPKHFETGGTVTESNKTSFEGFFMKKFNLGEKICSDKYQKYKKRNLSKTKEDRVDTAQNDKMEIEKHVETGLDPIRSYLPPPENISSTPEKLPDSEITPSKNGNFNNLINSQFISHQ